MANPKLSQADEQQQEQINALRDELETARADNTTALNQIDELAQHVATLKKSLDDVKSFLRVMHGNQQPTAQPAGQAPTAPSGNTSNTAQGNFPCPATTACKGHPKQEHVDAHVLQVQKAQQRQQQQTG